MEDNIVLYDFSKPNIPVAIKSWRIDGVRGVIHWQGALLAYGDEGMQWCNYGKNNTNYKPESVCTPIKDVAANQRKLYAITFDEIRVYSQRLCHITSARVEHAVCIMALGDKLIIGGNEGLTIVHRENMKHCHNHMGKLDITNLRPAFAHEPGLFIAQLADGTAKAFHLNGNDPEIVSDFNDMPWHNNSVLLGDLVVKVAKDSSIFDLYAIGKMELA